MPAIKPLVLPRAYLSYSQMDLWQKSREQYRLRYYLNGPSFESRETIFGKRFAKMMEDELQHPVADLVPRGDKTEYKILETILGVPVLGYLDGFNSNTLSILEYKTGKECWTNLRVAKHDQLVIYSLLVKKKHKKVNPVVSLVWVQTKEVAHSYNIAGVTFSANSCIDFTGYVQTFKRRIVQWERDKMKKKIRKVAEEISEDYQKFLITNTV